MGLFEVHKELCAKDGICETVCPVRIVRMDEESGYPGVSPEREQYCIGCGQCVAACPHAAITFNGIDCADMAAVDNGLAIGPEAAEQLLRSRRSVRHYKREPIPRELLERLLETTRWAPTGTNTQSVRYTLVSGQNMAKVSELVLEWMRSLLERQDPFAQRMNAALVVPAMEKGVDVACRNAPHLAVAHAGTESVTPAEDCHIGLAYLELAAHAHKLGACWAGFVTLAAQDSPEMLSYLQIPPGHTVYGSLLLGKPRFQFHRLPPRKPVRCNWM